MPLIKCPECEREVSNTAKFCPLCGYRAPDISLWKLDLGREGSLFHLLILIGLVLTFAGIYAAFSSAWGSMGAAAVVAAGLNIAFAGLLLLTIRSLR